MFIFFILFLFVELVGCTLMGMLINRQGILRLLQRILHREDIEKLSGLEVIEIFVEYLNNNL